MTGRPLTGRRVPLPGSRSERRDYRRSPPHRRWPAPVRRARRVTQRGGGHPPTGCRRGQGPSLPPGISWVIPPTGRAIHRRAPDLVNCPVPQVTPHRDVITLDHLKWLITRHMPTDREPDRVGGADERHRLASDNYTSGSPGSRAGQDPSERAKCRPIGVAGGGGVADDDRLGTRHGWTVPVAG